MNREYDKVCDKFYRYVFNCIQGVKEKYFVINGYKPSNKKHRLFVNYAICAGMTGKLKQIYCKMNIFSFLYFKTFTKFGKHKSIHRYSRKMTNNSNHTLDEYIQLFEKENELEEDYLIKIYDRFFKE